jgi:6-phosphogluconolactonase
MLPYITASDKVALGQRLAHDIVPELRAAIEVRGGPVLIVSGGSTPMPFFEALAASSLPLEKLSLLMADERWVAPDHDDSNEKLLHTAFAGTSAQIVSLAPYKGETVEEGAERLNVALQHQGLCADIAILGMGEDGHTASLFPHHAGLAQGLKADASCDVMAVKDSPKPPSERVTLTYAALMRSRRIIIHCTGIAKKNILAEAAVTHDMRALPIAAFMQQRSVPCSIYWCE